MVKLGFLLLSLFVLFSCSDLVLVCSLEKYELVTSWKETIEIGDFKEVTCEDDKGNDAICHIIDIFDDRLEFGLYIEIFLYSNGEIVYTKDRIMVPRTGEFWFFTPSNVGSPLSKKMEVILYEKLVLPIG